MKKWISLIMCTVLVFSTMSIDVYADDVIVAEEAMSGQDIDITEVIADESELSEDGNFVNDEVEIEENVIEDEEAVIHEEQEEVEAVEGIAIEDEAAIEEDSAVVDDDIKVVTTEAIVNDGSSPESIDKLLSTDINVINGKDVDASEVPYGHAAGEAFLLARQDELLLTVSDGKGNSDSNYHEIHQSYMDQVPKGDAWTDKMMDMQSVAFDPTEPTDDEHGRDKYVAYVGIKKDGRDNYVAYAWVENLKTKRKSNILSLGKTWGNKDDRLFSEYYASNNYVNITAGDYNGDRKDTVVVYAPLYGSSYDLKLLELSLNPSDMSLSIIHSGDALLHQKYRASNMKIYDKESHLGVDLATGDVNRDGIDDLAVTSYLANADEKGKGESTDLFIPQLSVARGVKSSDYDILAANSTNTSYGYMKEDAGKVSNQQVYNTMLIPAVTLADIDADGKDEIVTAGYKTQILTKEGHESIVKDARHNITNEKLNVEVFTFKDDDGVKTMASGSGVMSAVDTNGWTRYETSTSDYAMSKPVMVGYFPNGKVKGESVFISGTVYEFSGYVPQEKFTPDYFKKGDKGAGGAIVNRAGIIQAQAGNFSSSPAGREEVVYTIALHQQTFHDYHCFAGIITATYDDVSEGGKTTKYGDIKEYTSSNTNASSGSYYVNGYKNTADHPTNLLVTAVDCDDDGTIARFRSKMTLMGDVNVVAVLQAHPYFDDFATTEGETEYKVTETNIVATSNGVDADISFGVSYSSEAGALFKTSLDVEAGVKLTFDNEWETEHRYSTATAFSASDKDQIVVTRRPIYSYTFAIYDRDAGKWSDDPTYNKGNNEGNDFVITVNGQPEYTMLGIPEYNDFVVQYNDLVDTQSDRIKSYLESCGTNRADISIAKLESITDTHLGNEGNPYGYYAPREGAGVELEEFGGTTDYFDERNTSGTINGYMSESTSSTHRFAYSVGLEAGISAAAGIDIKAGQTMIGAYVRGSVSYAHSSTTGHEEETEVGCGMKGFGGEELTERTGVPSSIYDQFEFRWKPCSWKFYPEGKGDKKPVVPVIGYVVNKDAGAIDAPPKPVQGLNAIEEEHDGEPSVKLTWTNPDYRGSEAGYRMQVENYRIYAKNADDIHAGGYTLIDETKGGSLKTEYYIKKSLITAKLTEAGKSLSTDDKYNFVVSTICGNPSGTIYESVWSNDATVRVDDNRAVFYSSQGNGTVVIKDMTNGKNISNGGFVKSGENYNVVLNAGANSYLTKLVINQNGATDEKQYTHYEQNATEGFNAIDEPINITAYYATFKKLDLDIKAEKGGTVCVMDVTDGNKVIYNGNTNNLQDVIHEGHTIKVEALADMYDGLAEFTINGNNYAGEGEYTFVATADVNVKAVFERELCKVELESQHGQLEVAAYEMEDNATLGSLQTSNISVWKGQKIKIVDIPEADYICSGIYINGNRVDNTGLITINDSMISNGIIKLKGDFEKATVELDKSAYPYTGEDIIPQISVTVGSTLLNEDVDYFVEYKNNKDIGIAKYVITCIGNYSGRLSESFTITKGIQTVTASVKSNSLGVGKKTQITATGIGEITYQSSNTAIATVSSSGVVTAKKVGTAKITVTAAGDENYDVGTKTLTIKAIPAATTSVKATNTTDGVKITWKKVAGATGYYIYRSDKKIATVKGNSNVSYVDKKAKTNGTKYTYKVYAYASTGKGLASKTAISYYLSKPQAATLSSTSVAKVKATWKKNAKASGYQLMYAYDSGYKNSPKTITIKDKKTLAKTIKNLKKGKKVYIRIRSYKVVSNVNYYSPWSSSKKIVVKK